ncbi:hypothetical protein BGM26_19100 [Bacillus sp. FJAT-29790]|uniref:hypothetical protein n=1 Tax=Bacillus sp. FJAT-29790 TaxID=1895002 RepID=UPI001C22FFDF|nr:hypothetical protein [Bacillus sp. FJAT-29790]MBU8881032.1 hypothetical protein [Bacillus sp. FJAT-29790]
MKKLSIFILLLAFIAGCNQNQSGKNETRDGTTFISNRLDRQEYNTRDWTMDSQNPNFLNFNGNQVNNSTDIDKAKQVIDATSEYQSGPIWINGRDMWVTAYKREMMSDRERIEAEARLHKKLIKALPRYHIDVKVQEDRT